MYDFDVISIGAGSGGCASAMRCADLGKRVALVEMRKQGTGGTCVNRGCIPTKVLVKSASVLNQIRASANYGIDVEGVKPNLKQIHKKKIAAINGLRFGLDNLLIKPRKIERIAGAARFMDAHTIAVTDDKGQDKQFTAENFVISTGSEPAMIPAFHINGETIITSDEALTLQELPEDMIVIGAGALGLEFAYVFSSFGCKITIAEMMPHVVPVMKEPEIANAVEAHLKKAGITLKTGSPILEIVELPNGRVECRFVDGNAVQAQMVLVAIGRSLNTEGLGLAEIGVELTPKGQVVTNDFMQTSIPNIYAAGDITVGPQLSHKAQKQGLVAAENIAGNKTQMCYDVIPWAIFMQPEIAAVGLTKADAEEKGIAVITGKMPFSANEKAMSMQETAGLVKLVAEKESHRLIGGQIFGVDASVLIAEIAVAVEKGLTLEDIANSIHAHPTLSEILMETAKNALGRAFHRT